MKPETYCNLFYTVEFVYNGFVCNVSSPTTLHFVRSRSVACRGLVMPGATA